MEKTLLAERIAESANYARDLGLLVWDAGMTNLMATFKAAVKKTLLLLANHDEFAAEYGLFISFYGEWV